jgi:CBS domain-containing protein
LGFLLVSDVVVTAGPMVTAGAAPDDARAAMDKHGSDWVGVLDDDRLLGWVYGRDLNGVARVGDATTERFRAWVTTETPLREALDLIVDSRTRVAVVLDGDRYLGMLTIDQIAEGME